MTRKVFIDTNILVYSMDNYESAKQSKCRKLLKKLVNDFRGVISTQVMQEFYVTTTKKLKANPIYVKNVLNSFEHFEIVNVNSEIIKDSIDCSIINRISFWDALIITSAEHSKCEQVWTENLNDGQIIKGVQIVNPLKI